MLGVMEIEASLEQAMKSVMNSVEEINKKLDAVQVILNNLDARVAVTNNTAGKTLGETNQTIGAMRLG
jgi:prefoldin subunit 5